MANFSYFYLEPNAADAYLAGAGASFWIDRSTEHMQIIAKFEGCHSSRSQTFMLSALGGGGGEGGRKPLKCRACRAVVGFTT